MDDGYPLLHRAAKYGNVSLIESLLLSEEHIDQVSFVVNIIIVD